VFERFTADARQAVQLAASEARVLGTNRIGAEQLLLALAHGRSGTAAAALRAAGVDAARLRPLTVARTDSAPLDAEALAVLGIDLDQVRRAAEAAFGPGALDRPAHASRAVRFKMTQEAKDAIAGGLRVAHGRHDREFTSGHLLAGLIDQGDNEALRLLAAAGVDPGALRADVMRRMTQAA
jgi:ATP-dependent Clp protease ATP-binding subunit ClpA